MKLKLFFASLMLAFACLFLTPITQANAAMKTDGVSQSQAAQPLEMQRRHGYRGHRGYGRRMHAPRRHYNRGWAPRRHYGFYGMRPAMCRTYIVYDAWGFARRVRRCR
jgi:hypothetical protein